MNEKRSKLQHMWKYMFLCVFVFSIALSANAQQKSIKGVVTNVDNEPLVGVSVVVPETTIGVATDTDGRFVLQVPKGTNELHVSFIGYESVNVPIKFKKVVYVTLKEEMSEIDEVQVTALGVKKLTKKIGYSASEVKGEDLAKLNVVNPVSALQGQVAGLSISNSDGGLFGSARIQLRGNAVLGSNDNQPIFVVDGFIQNVGSSGYNIWGGGYAGDWGSVLKNLDMAIVESVTVLKGAAATALYGSRGINGAIVVKTKGADSALRGLGITIKQTAGWTDAYRSMDFQYKYGPGHWHPGANFGSEGNPWNTKDAFLTEDGNVNLHDNYVGVGWGPAYDDYENCYYHDGSIRPYTPVKDHHLRAFQTGQMSETHVSVNGGNEKTRFFIAETYTKRKGIYFGNDMDRNSIKISGSHRLNKKWRVGGDVTLTKSKPKNPNNSIGYQYHWGSFDTMYDAREFGTREYSIADHGGRSGASNDDKYAYIPGNGTWFDYYTHSRDRTELLALYRAYFEFKPVDWVTLKGTYMRKGYDIDFEESKLSPDFANGGEGGYYAIEKSTHVAETFRFTASFDKKINEDIELNGLIATERWQTNYNRLKTNTHGGLIVPTMFTLGNSKKNLKSGGTYNSKKIINSIYGLIGVSYKDMLFVEVTGRNDWSSSLTYAVGPSNNSYFYPSVSGSWLTDKTFELPEWISMAKVRASWAQVGNDTGTYWLNPGNGTSSKEYNGVPSYFTTTVDSQIDPDVKPQMKTSWEFGIDLRMFKNRVGLDLAYYDDVIKNQIGTVGLNSISGFRNIRTNIGTLGNRGWEVALDLTPVRSKNFEWETTFKYWNNHNVIKKLHEYYNGSYHLGGDAGWGHFHSAVTGYEGGTYGKIISTCSPKVYKNEDDLNDPLNGKKLLTYSSNYRTSYVKRSGEVEVVGDINPDFEGSVYNSIRYKNLRLSFLIDAKLGYTIASHEARYGISAGQTKSSLVGRDLENGGVKFQSRHKSDQGFEYTDGIIFDDSYVFDKGVKVTNFAGEVVDLGGMTMSEAIEAGAVDPNHAGLHYNFYVGWSNGVVSDLWLKKAYTVAVRNISLQYDFSSKIASKIGAKGLSIIANVRNPFYIYTNLPDHVNPESIRGNQYSSYYTQSNVPYTRQFTFSITANF